MTTRTHPWPSIATPSASRSATTSHTAGCAGSRSAPPTSPACRFPGFPFVFKLDKTHRVDVTHDFRSDHDRLFHPGNQDRAASRVRPGDGQGGVRRPARRPAADRRVLLRRLRGRGPADRAGAGRWTAGHDLTGGLLARAGHRGEAGRGDRRGCHREGARARRRLGPPGGHRHRPRWQRPRAASGPMSADPRSRAQRRRDTEHRLTHDIDVWVASASADGAPYLVPLSFDWDGEALRVATPTDSPTGRNLAATRAVRLGLGHTPDVSMLEGEVEVLEHALPQELGDRFIAHTGFDPRALATPYRWLV